MRASSQGVLLHLSGRVLESQGWRWRPPEVLRARVENVHGPMHALPVDSVGGRRDRTVLVSRSSRLPRQLGLETEALGVELDCSRRLRRLGEILGQHAHLQEESTTGIICGTLLLEKIRYRLHDLCSISILSGQVLKKVKSYLGSEIIGLHNRPSFCKTEAHCPEALQY
jgi:hypothetical protein